MCMCGCFLCGGYPPWDNLKAKQPENPTFVGIPYFETHPCVRVWARTALMNGLLFDKSVSQPPIFKEP